MKKYLISILAFIFSLTLLASCGKSRAEELMDRYTDIANTYSSYSQAVAAANDTRKLTDFSTLGFDLTDIASKLSKGEELTNEDLDTISAALDDITAKLAAFAPAQSE